jgi:hypothetical protein
VKAFIRNKSLIHVEKVFMLNYGRRLFADNYFIFENSTEFASVHVFQDNALFDHPEIFDKEQIVFLNEKPFLLTLNLISELSVKSLVVDGISLIAGDGLDLPFE